MVEAALLNHIEDRVDAMELDLEFLVGVGLRFGDRAGVGDLDDVNP